ncbi:MAG: hypothetical protein ACOC3J_06675 [Gemmatimonadota bacterium]
MLNRAGRALSAALELRGRSVAFGAVLALLVAGRAEGQFSVQPVIMELRPGDSASVATFAVRNEAPEALQLRIYAADFDQPESGSHTFTEAGTHARSCYDRLRLFPDNLTVPAKSEGQVRVRLEPGAGTCWSVVFVQSQAAGDGGIRIAQRIGVKVYGVAPDARPAGEVLAVDVTEAPADRAVSILFENTGEGPIRPEGEVEIRTTAGEIVAVVPVPPFSVLPGRSRQTRVPLDRPLEPGRYLAIPILDFGAEYLAADQASFEVGG